MRTRHFFFLFLLLFIFQVPACTTGPDALPSTSTASPDRGGFQYEDYEKKQVMIPMRDGVKLNTEIHRPKAAKGPLPIIFLRTPYGIPPYKKGGDNYYIKLIFKEIVSEGYIFVFQDMRGRYHSEGRFVLNRKPRDKKIPGSIDETTDAYDSIQWLVTHVPGNNGKVGMVGGSYSGWASAMAMLEPHPALKAVILQATPADFYIGDDFFHNGAFRLDYGFEFAYYTEHSRTNSFFPFGGADLYQFFLDLGPLSNVNRKHFHGRLPTWNRFMEHPNYDAFWRQRNLPRYFKGVPVPVPTLNVAGWWDAEDFYGPMVLYDTLEKLDTHNRNFLVVGPWFHGGWSFRKGRKLGPIDFQNNTAEVYRKDIEAPWFAYYLKGKGSPDRPESFTFRTGCNRWVNSPRWPPQEGVSVRPLYFREKGKLSFRPVPSPGRGGKTVYVSDPANPVPYTKRPIKAFLKFTGARAKFEDQRFLKDRKDVVRWETDILARDVTVAGRIIANFYASTTGTDCDWVIKLIDVYPDPNPENPAMAGYQLLIADEVMRAKFRGSLAKPEAVPSGEVVTYTLDLNSRHHCFLKGHRIMVQVQSSWFPLIDRNPQKFIDIPKAKPEDFQKAVQEIHFSPSYPSHIKLPVLETPNSSK